MITCSACAHENVDGTQFCENCGEELPQVSSAASSGDLTKCPNCGHQNPEDNLACEACGTELQTPLLNAPTAPAPIFDPFESQLTTAPAISVPPVAPTMNPDAAPLEAGNLAPGNVKLVVEQGQSVGAQFVLGDVEILVGREDEEEEIYPDIDLSDQDAGYVHRRHAILSFDNGNLMATHLGGANKTRINNRPLPDNVPSVVKLGDKIAFGKVVLRLLPV